MQLFAPYSFDYLTDPALKYGQQLLRVEIMADGKTPTPESNPLLANLLTLAPSVGAMLNDPHGGHDASGIAALADGLNTLNQNIRDLLKAGGTVTPEMLAAVKKYAGDMGDMVDYTENFVQLAASSTGLSQDDRAMLEQSKALLEALRNTKNLIDANGQLQADAAQTLQGQEGEAIAANADNAENEGQAATSGNVSGESENVTAAERGHSRSIASEASEAALQPERHQELLQNFANELARMNLPPEVRAEMQKEMSGSLQAVADPNIASNMVKDRLTQEQNNIQIGEAQNQIAMHRETVAKVALAAQGVKVASTGFGALFSPAQFADIAKIGAHLATFAPAGIKANDAPAAPAQTPEVAVAQTPAIALPDR